MKFNKNKYGQSFIYSCQLFRLISEQTNEKVYLCWSFKFHQWTVQNAVSFKRLENALELEIIYPNE